MKTHVVPGTPFILYWGGREVAGQCKWVVDCDDLQILDDFLMDWDGLYCYKDEAIDRCQEWWEDNGQDYA